MRKRRESLLRQLAMGSGILGVSGGPSDTTAPTCAITADVATITAAAFTATFTFSEEVTGFEIGDITLSANAGASNFATADNIVFTATITPTATGTVTVDVAAEVCTDAAGNPNEAATQFSIIAIVYALDDLFTTADDAPLTSPRTCEPGPGTIAFTDTGNRGSIASGALRYTLSAGTGWGNPGGWGGAITRDAGMAFLGRVSASIRTNSMLGFDGNTASTLDESALHLSSDGTLNARVGAASFPLVTTYAAASELSVEVILRDTGFFLVVNDELLFVDAGRTTATVYPALVAGDHSAGGPVLSYASAKVAQLPAPWDTDNGIATQVLAGARAANDTFTHEGNCLIEFTLTTRPTAGNVDIRFRMQDASNYWQLIIASTGVMTLNEVVADTPTERANSGANTVSTGNRIVISCRGTTIRAQGTFEAADTCVYTSAANFQTETDGLLADEGTGGSVSTIITWPMTLSGNAKAVLDAANP